MGSRPFCSDTQRARRRTLRAMRAALGRSPGRRPPGRRLRGAGTFWALLALAAIVTLPGPVVLGIDNKLQLPSPVGLLPVRPSVQWPNLISNGPPGSNPKHVVPAGAPVALLASVATPAVVTGSSQATTTASGGRNAKAGQA